MFYNLSPPHLQLFIDYSELFNSAILELQVKFNIELLFPQLFDPTF